jgi:hypothetical protein
MTSVGIAVGVAVGVAVWLLLMLLLLLLIEGHIGNPHIKVMAIVLFHYVLPCSHGERRQAIDACGTELED